MEIFSFKMHKDNRTRNPGYTPGAESRPIFLTLFPVLNWSVKLHPGRLRLGNQERKQGRAGFPGRAGLL